MSKKKKKLLEKDKALKEFVKQGGSKTGHEDFFFVLKQSSQPKKASR